MFFAGATDDIYLQIVRFAGMQTVARRWTGGQLIWAGPVGVREFVDQVLDMAEKVLNDHGVRIPTQIHGAESSFQ